MNPVLCRYAIAATVLTFGLFQASSAVAQRATILDSARAAYFATQLYALPIILPQEDIPGDIYIDPIRKFQFRSEDCFPGTPIDTVDTVLPSYFEQNQSTLEAEFAGSLPDIASALVSVGVDTGDKLSISFADARAHSMTWDEITTGLANTSNEACRDHIEWTLMQDSSSDPWRSIPWILATVIEARESYTFETSQNITVGAEVEADLARLFRQLPVPVEIAPGIELSNGTTRRIQLLTEQSYPVAYRPAFISLEHMEELKAIEAGGFFRAVWQFFGGASDFETIEAIRSEFPEQLRHADETLKSMVEGTAVRFENENEEHLAYMRNAGLMLAAGIEAYGLPDSIEYVASR
ncbi:hypothetical protein [Pelagibacterium halotolerans]|uniref:hypothetical protein n=1 Tax=Pelagibacterium halotolerans TaxID=531813 RepID=UPI00384C5220